MAIGTIRAETGDSSRSASSCRVSTPHERHPSTLRWSGIWEPGSADGSAFKGAVSSSQARQLPEVQRPTGLGNGLVDNPELANDAKVAADLLALFLKDKEARIRDALLDDDLRTARKLVNGGAHGLTEFSEAYRVGDALLG
jgi:peptidoglycan L-alanyl-D-glutamate endopeptidase CwlK